MSREKEPTMTTPELRLSPDGQRIAWRFADGSWGWRDINGPYFSAIATPDEVEGWTRLVPAPAAADRDAVVRAIIESASSGAAYGYCDPEGAIDGDTRVFAEAIADGLIARGFRAVPAVPAATNPLLINEATTHHLATVILADLADEYDPESPAHPERIAGYTAGMRRAAELVCESSSIAHTVPAADDQEQRTAALVAEALRAHQRTRGMAVASGWTCQCGHWASDYTGWIDHQAAAVAAAIAALREVPRG